MSSTLTKTAVLSAMALVWLAAASLAPACDTPVYRYALEGWSPDPYVAFIFYEGEWTEEQNEIVTFLRTTTESEKAPTNIYVHTVDISGEMNKTDSGVWELVKTESLPLVVVTVPGLPNGEGIVWKSPLDLASTRLIVDSPLRHEVATRLIRGETCVWILVESGNKEVDDEVAQLLETIPLETPPREVAPDPYASMEDGPGADPEADPDTESITKKWEMNSSVLRVSRANAVEAMLLKTLLGSESDLYDREYEGEPMVFPIFGRGRALYALVGKGINRENILTACEFLLGPCACEIKIFNPGTDLLIAANWDLVHSTMAEEIELPSLAHIDPPRVDIEPLPPVAVAAPGVEPVPAEVDAGGLSIGATLINTIYLLAGMFVLVIVLTVAIRVRAGTRG